MRGGGVGAGGDDGTTGRKEGRMEEDRERGRTPDRGSSCCRWWCHLAPNGCTQGVVALPLLAYTQGRPWVYAKTGSATTPCVHRFGARLGGATSTTTNRDPRTLKLTNETGKRRLSRSKPRRRAERRRRRGKVGSRGDCTCVSLTLGPYIFSSVGDAQATAGAY